MQIAKMEVARMTISFRTLDLTKLNALTRYPSIPNYHPYDPNAPRQRAKPEVILPAVQFPDSVLLTEKIDGAQARLVVAPDGSYLIGSREEFLYAAGDLVHNGCFNIVETVKPHLGKMIRAAAVEDGVVVWYGEVYGGKITQGSSQYSIENRFGFRLFDVSMIPQLAELMQSDLEQIKSWHDGGGLPFVDEAELQRLANASGQALTPRLGEIEGHALPQTVEGGLSFLERIIPKTKAILDKGAHAKAEGIVVRTPTRSIIAKLRYRDYQDLNKGRPR
jgi:hypothetical protein